MKRILLFVAFIFSACHQNTTVDELRARNGNKEINLGEKFSKSAAISYSDFLKAFQGKTELQSTVIGQVGAVCQKKGCWMYMQSAQETDDEMFVQFKDYGFFMPLDLTGNQVVLKGKAYKETFSVGDLKHFAEDDGKSAEEIALITAPEEKLKFLADGVIILD